MKLLSILLITCLVTPAFADQSVLLDKGTPAPFSGFLLDKEKAGKVRLLDLDYQESLKTQGYLKADNDLYVKRLENMTTENDRLAKQVQDSRTTGIWSTIGIFLLGSAATIAMTYGVSHAIR